MYISPVYIWLGGFISGTRLAQPVQMLGSPFPLSSSPSISLSLSCSPPACVQLPPHWMGMNPPKTYNPHLSLSLSLSLTEKDALFQKRPFVIVVVVPSTVCGEGETFFFKISYNDVSLSMWGYSRKGFLRCHHIWECEGAMRSQKDVWLVPPAHPPLFYLDSPTHTHTLTPEFLCISQRRASSSQRQDKEERRERERNHPPNTPPPSPPFSHTQQIEKLLLSREDLSCFGTTHKACFQPWNFASGHI